jgi:tetratricopeptide (TPR) repeat protein
MKTRILISTLLIAGLLGACSALSPEPTPTPTPEPTATPIPPTPTPAPSEILSDGWAAYDSGDLETAAEIAGQVIEQFPEDGEAYALLGAVMVEQGELVEAIEQLETARDLGYEDANTDILLLQSYAERASQIIDEIYATWDYEEIRDLIYEARDYIEKARTSGLGRSERISALDDWFNRPIETLPRALEEQSPAFSYWQSAVEYEQAGHLDRAITMMTSAIDAEPDSAFLYDYRAYLSTERDDYAAALEDMEAVLGINPNLMEARTDLGFLYGYRFLPLHARNEFITAMLADPQNENSEEGLDVLGLTFGTWDDTLFLDYGFRFSLSGDGEFFEFQEDMNSAEEGAIGYIDSSTFLSMIWMPYEEWRGADLSIRQAVRQTPPFNMFGETSHIGDPLVFAYNPVEIIYQPYLLIPDEDEEDATLGIYAIWTCDETIFILSQMIGQAEDEYLFMFNPTLESATCDLESIVPEHP